MLSNLQPGQGLGGSGSQLLGLGGGWLDQLRQIIYGAACVFSAQGQAAAYSLTGGAATFAAQGRNMVGSLTASAAIFATRAKSALFNLIGRS